MRRWTGWRTATQFSSTTRSGGWPPAVGPLHRSYLLWRCNWIHPFANGNGRTTRGLAYLTFLLRLRYEPGGAPTFVDMISADKFLYYDALDAADAAWSAGKLDVSAMEQTVSKLIARQLVQIVDDAGAR